MSAVDHFPPHQNAEAGPSQPHYPSTTATLPNSPRLSVNGDVSMDRQENKGRTQPSIDENNEEASLLLNIASLPPPRPPYSGDNSQPVAAHIEKPFPYTPPDDTQASDQPPQDAQPSFLPPLGVFPSDTQQESSLPSPNATRSTPDAPSKPTKTKRKRNNQGSVSSRRTSTDRPSADPERPPHYLGEDNSLIRCICGFEEDDGFTMQCDGCGAWEHGLCFGYMDANQLPDSYLCELCAPRHYDADAARRRQQLARQESEEKNLIRNGSLPPDMTRYPVKEKEKPKSKSKAKRARMGSVLDGEGDVANTSGKDPSPGAMGPPPSTKPKRRPTANKPRSKPSMQDSAPIQASFPLPESAPIEIEDDYFRIEPWAMEFTPVQQNLVRGRQARQAILNFFHEWLDADDEEVSSNKRSVNFGQSGLPSPTETGASRMSPETSFASPDFSLLAPPIPPVFLTHSDLDEMAISTSIELISAGSSFLPLNYGEDDVGGGVYSQPAIYGVFVDEAVSSGTFIGEYRGEVIDGENYRNDPINQYPGLGAPKPHVHFLAPPLNLVIDSRGYGSNLRFVRSGCHPNAVLRPILWRSDSSSTPQFKVGVFASHAIRKGEEITLGWEWDDQHVVHSIQHLVMSLLAYDNEDALKIDEIRNIATKYEDVLKHLLGTFTICACRKHTRCAFAQMRAVVEDQRPEVDIVKGKARLDFGPLVGAVRGWRRMDVECAALRRWNTPREVVVRNVRSFAHVFDTETLADADKTDEEPTLVAEEINKPKAVLAYTPVRDDTEGEELPDEEQQASAAQSENDDRMDVDRAEDKSSSPKPPMSPLMEDMEEDDGHDSDGTGTTATLPRSHFSDSEADEKMEPMSPERKPLKQSPIKIRKVANGKKTKKPRQALEQDDVVRDLPSGLKPRSRNIPNGDLPSSPIRAGPARRGRKVKRVASSASEDDTERLPMKVPKAPVAPASSALTEIFAPEEPEPQRESAQAATEMVEAPAAQLVPEDPAPREDTQQSMEIDQQEELPAVKEPTPPRDPTPPPKEPTPEPPKKISLSEYLKTHKIRKESVPMPSNETIMEVEEAKSDIPGFGSATDLGTPQAPTQSLTLDTSLQLEVKPDPDARPTGDGMNFMEFLPTSIPGAPGMKTDITVMDSPQVLTASTPSAAFKPRSEYFPPQPASTSFVPRSSSYTPRQAITPLENGDTPQPPAPVSSYVPRQASYGSTVTSNGPDTPLEDQGQSRVTSYGYPAQTTQADEPPREMLTPLRNTTSLPAENGGYQSRERDGSTRSPPSGPRIPTGPKIPPTGPRGSWGPVSTPGAQASPAPARLPESIRGGYANGPPRGLGGRGRGGYPGSGERGYSDREEPFGGGPRKFGFRGGANGVAGGRGFLRGRGR